MDLDIQRENKHLSSKGKKTLKIGKYNCNLLLHKLEIIFILYGHIVHK